MACRRAARRPAARRRAAGVACLAVLAGWCVSLAAAGAVAAAPGRVTAATVAGYWQVASDGGVFTFGDAVFYGSTGDIHLAKPVVGMAATPDGHGYWLVASDGGVFTFGDAGYRGSVPALGVRAAPAVGLLATPDGAGYRAVGADGTSWAFGDAAPAPSLPSLGVHTQSIVGGAAPPGGAGFWEVGADGGVFSFGGAPYLGSLPATGVRVGDVVGMAVAASGAPSTSPAGSASWSAPQPFDPAATGATTVSCATPSFCAAVDGTDQVWTWTGSWSAPTALAGTRLSGMACASATFCMATGMTTGGASAMTDAVVYNGSAWAQAPSFAPTATVGGLVSVSCPTTAFCAAVGDAPGTGGLATTLVETFNGSRWAVTPSQNPAGSTSGGFSLLSVSCAGATACAAVGDYTEGPDAFAFVETGGPSGWSVASVPGLQAEFTLASVSCPTVTSCTAVGNESFPHTPTAPRALVVTDTGGAWSVGASPPPAPLWPVSCTTASHCVAGGPGGIVTTLDASAWSAPVSVDGADIITSMSCTAGGFCMATDNAGYALTTADG